VRNENEPRSQPAEHHAGDAQGGDALDWQRALRSHPRDWRGNLYVYPVLSRRAKGISIGINLNPDRACNFRCVYCQVDRTSPVRVRRVHLDRLSRELHEMLEQVRSGALFREQPFADAPAKMHRVADIAFSGDGEPTASPVFADAVQLVIDAKASAGLENDLPVVVLTNAALLDRPSVRDALDRLHNCGGAIWAKLEAGSEEYFRQISRANISLQQIVDNITFAAKRWRVLIQSLWMQLHGVGPARSEVEAFADRLAAILAAGGRIEAVQVYTIARKPAEPFVSALSPEPLREIAELVAERTGLSVEVYPSPA